MTKVFISQPMRGKPDDEILREREALIRATEEEFGEVEILDSYFADYDGNALQFLAKSIAVLAHADVAVFAIDWESARGCRCEHRIAEEYGVTIVEHHGHID